MAPEAVAFVAQTLLDMGCYEVRGASHIILLSHWYSVHSASMSFNALFNANAAAILFPPLPQVSLGDTIGVGTPIGVRELLAAVGSHVPLHAVAVHFHNTYGAAQANILAALEHGVGVVDAAVAGLGGCPYAKGASGNVPTEDVVYLLSGMGIRTNIDLNALAETGTWICGELGRENQSRVGVARAAQRRALVELERELEGRPATAADVEELRVRHLGLSWPHPPLPPPPVSEREGGGGVAEQSAASIVTGTADHTAVSSLHVGGRRPPLPPMQQPGTSAAMSGATIPAAAASQIHVR